MTSKSGGPRRAYVLYDAKVCFEVNLQTEEVEKAELFSASLEHFDTGLDVAPHDALEWTRAQLRALRIVSSNGLEAPLFWNTKL
jgi:hypothetical protein